MPTHYTRHMDPLQIGAASLAKALDPSAQEAAKLGGELGRNLLGPLTQEIGVGWADAYRRRNLERVASRAAKKANRTGGSGGTIPPRVASQVFDAAQYAEDEFVAEYLSGVLASAQSPEGIDDSGVSWTAQVARLAAKDLLLHYALYNAFRRLVLGVEVDAFSDLTNQHLYVTHETLQLLGFTSDHTLYESIYGLRSEGLIGDRLAHGPGDYLKKSQGEQYDFGAGGVIFAVSERGVYLFLHGHGYGQRWVADITDPELDFTFDGQATVQLDEFQIAWVKDLAAPAAADFTSPEPGSSENGSATV